MTIKPDRSPDEQPLTDSGAGQSGPGTRGPFGQGAGGGRRLA